MTENTLTISACPSCGSERIRIVCRDVKRGAGDSVYLVPKLTFFECPDCGEQVYDQRAMRRIEECSPTFVKAKSG